MATNITRLSVAGFKSAMSPVAVNIRGVTILAGQNNAGKSTIIQPALMIKQTLEKPFDPGGLAIDGPLVKFTNANQFLSGSRRSKRNGSFEVEIGTEDNDFRLVFKNSQAGGLTPAEMHFTTAGSQQKWIVGQTLPLDDPSLDSELHTATWFLKLVDTIRIERMRCWLAPRATSKHEPSINFEISAMSPIAAPIQLIQDMIYLPGLRGNPERNYSISGVGPNFPGSFAGYVASIIHAWGEKRDANIDRLGDSLRTLGLTWKVIAKRLDDTQVEIRVGRLPAAAQGGAHDTVSIADVGFGVSQILPVLVALLVARKDQIVFIEQPEIHLHPHAQSKLAGLILDAAERGVRVIIETHSGLLLLALQTLVSEGRIDPSRVSFNWFTRGPKGQTKVIEAEIGPDGSYGDWPVDFGSIELELENRFLNSFDRHRAMPRLEG